MKRTITLIVMVAMVALNLQAQDTIRSRSLNRTYLADVWAIDTCSDTVLARHAVEGWTSAREMSARRFYSKDSIRIYGIAASMCRQNFGEEVYDTSLENAYEYFAFYNIVGDSAICISDSLKFHMRDTPIKYYQDFHRLVRPAYFPGDSVFYPIVPFSELYFDQPITVADTFWLGVSSRSSALYSEEGQPYYYYSTPFYLHAIWLSPNIPSDQWGKTIIFIKEGYWPGVRYYRQDEPLHVLTYPILSPISPADTTHIDTTSTGIATLLERYTTLRPNPAADQVQVLSSFGFSQIELYNAAGVRLLEQKATGYSATLDVSALPAGPYLVRIATAAGTVTRKLVVQRR